MAEKARLLKLNTVKLAYRLNKSKVVEITRLIDEAEDFRVVFGELLYSLELQCNAFVTSELYDEMVEDAVVAYDDCTSSATIKKDIADNVVIVLSVKKKY